VLQRKRAPNRTVSNGPLNQLETDPPGVAALKATLRAAARKALKGITFEQKAADSADACHRLEGQTVWRTAKAVLFYAPMPEELDVALLARGALRSGKRVALPRYDTESRCYRACEIRVPLEEIPVGQFGIREPGAGSPVVSMNDLDFILVPGLAFDEQGRRLGRGRGYYDRLLAGVQATKCGLGFDLQVYPQIPVEPHDILLDCILTPGRWLDFRSRLHGH
jgi:5-formyltetrahydrofolate cyclo-ligase